MKIKVRQRYYKSAPYYIIQGLGKSWCFYTDIDMAIPFDQMISMAQASYKALHAD